MLDVSWLFSCSSQDPGYLQDVHYVAFLLSPRTRVKSLRHRRENPQTADGLPLANVAKLFRQHKQKMLPYIDKFYASNPYVRSCAAIEWERVPNEHWQVCRAVFPGRPLVHDRMVADMHEKHVPGQDGLPSGQPPGFQPECRTWLGSFVPTNHPASKPPEHAVGH